MEVTEVIAILRREKNLNEAEANEQAYAMLATVKSKHPRIAITAVVVDGQTTTLCLKNGTQVKFDPTLPVPIWKYHEGARTTNPKRQDNSVFRSLNHLEGLERKWVFAKTAEEKQEAADAIAQLLKRNGVKTEDELRKRVHAAAAIERGEDDID